MVCMVLFEADVPQEEFASCPLSRSVSDHGKMHEEGVKVSVFRSTYCIHVEVVVIFFSNRGQGQPAGESR